MLLALGLTQVPLAAALAIILWLCLLSWRGRDSFLSLRPLFFNLMQILLIVLTALALVIFVGVA